MNPDPKQLLQIIHNRGEQWWSNPQAINDARQAAQKLDEWITERLTYIQAPKDEVKKDNK